MYGTTAYILLKGYATITQKMRERAYSGRIVERALGLGRTRLVAMRGRSAIVADARLGWGARDPLAYEARSVATAFRISIEVVTRLLEQQVQIAFLNEELGREKKIAQIQRKFDALRE